MNHSYGTTDIATPERVDSSEHDFEIEEADIFELAPYESDTDDRTLVGLGPVLARYGLKETAQTPALQPGQPSSQPPGAWGSDEETIPASIRRSKLGVWGVALPLLLVVAAVAVVFLRALGAPNAPKPERREFSVAPPVVKESAALAVNVSGADVRVFLDGRDRGRPPLLLTELAPGSHALSISGPAYAPFEQPILLFNDHVSTLEPKLVFVRGSISLAAGSGADGASVEVIGANERRAIERLPARLEASPGDYQIVAKKPGFPAFESSVTLSPATPDVDVLVEFNKPASAVLAHAAKPSANDSEPAVPADAASATGSLSITSSPPSNVVLDGRPLGKAPRDVDVPAGSHTVVFVHPQFGRQSITVNVVPGRTTSASADF
jgi:PEGA domain